MMLKAIRSYNLSALALLTLLTPVLNAQVRQHPMAAPAPDLTCSPAPCVFPNVQVSSGYPSLSNVIAANPSNPAQMLVGAEEANCKSGVGVYSTEDAGTTWGHACLPVHPNSRSGERPLLAYGLDGVAYAGTDAPLTLTNRNDIYISSSRDNGKTWGTPRTVLTAYSAYATRLGVDVSPTSPFRGALYVSGGTFPGKVIVSHSNDGGKSWAGVQVDRVIGAIINFYPDLAIAADGTVYATWMRCKQKPPDYSCGDRLAGMMLSKSMDGGNTWGAPVEIAQARLAPDQFGYWQWGTLPGSDVPMSNFPVVAVDDSSGPNAGNVYVSFYNYNGNHMQVGVVTSKDAGQTWSAPVRVSNSPSGDEFFQWVSVAADGTVGVTWLDTREAGQVLYQPYFSISSDGGATFTGDHPLSNALSNPVKDGIDSFIGEFRTHVWVGNALYATWMDNHARNFQVAIGGVQF